MAPTTGHLTTTAAAARLGVSPSTLRRWVADGRVRHVELPSGRLRFAVTDLDALLAPRGGPPAKSTNATSAA